MSYLSSWTKELFDYDDNLILYDLTNTYAEGCYDDSKVWDYGRSKEKRHDCKLIVLALVVNSHGFPKHYQLFDGRMTDTDSLQKIIDSLDEQMKSLGVSPIVVMDAGISTEENLAMLKKKGYKYLCVSRSSSKVYDTIEGEEKQQFTDKRGQQLEIQRVKVTHKPDKDGNLPASATSSVRRASTRPGRRFSRSCSLRSPSHLRLRTCRMSPFTWSNARKRLQRSPRYTRRSAPAPAPTKQKICVGTSFTSKK